MEKVASSSQIDISQLSESDLSNAPDIEAIANDIIIRNTVSSTLFSALVDAVAAPTIVDIIDDSLRRTLVDTNFVEVFLENYKSLVEANWVAGLCAEKLRAMEEQSGGSEVVEARIKTLAEQILVTKDHVEIFANLAGQIDNDVELNKIIKGFLEYSNFSSIISERIGEITRDSEAFKSLDHVMRDIMARVDYGCIDKSVRNELNRSYERAVARILLDMQAEGYRHLPWDHFIELTAGSLADDPIERPETIAPVAIDDLE